MSAWEILAIWFGGSVVFSPLIGYFLSILAEKQTATINAKVIQFRPRAARADAASGWQPDLGASAFRS